MAQLASKFDATEHDTEQRDFEGLPNGIYEFEVEASEIVETGPEKDRTGNGMKYTANVREPEALAGRKFFGFINLENKNAQAQEIGQKELASMCRAIGITEVEDTEELHLQPFIVKIGMGKPSKKKDADGNPEYPAKSEIKKYFFPDEGNLPEPAIDENQPVKAANDNRAPAASDNKPAPAKAAAAGGKKRPWG